MEGVYRKQRAHGEKIVTQCNEAAGCKTAIQIARFLTSAAYNLVLESALLRPPLSPESAGESRRSR
jgi:hypothetical protein